LGLDGVKRHDKYSTYETVASINGILFSKNLFIRDTLKVIIKSIVQARCWWLMPIIVATLEVKIRRIAVQGQPQAKSS
jgi:hypothetical protein